MSEQQDPRRWVVLAVGVLGLIAGCAAQYGIAFLIPAMRAESLTLEEASLVVTAPIAGIMCTLIAWGAAADRWGERRTLALGLVGAGVAELAAAQLDHSPARWAFLFLVGAMSASIHSASGRLILGWFGAAERGLAMGIRQMGLPLGIGLAALTLPGLATDGIGRALTVIGVACLGAGALVTLVVRDPARPTPGTTAAPGAPYRAPYLWRIHAASGLLVIPQIAVAVFAFDYLVNGLGWSAPAAGFLVAATQIAGAGTRLVAGWWSDRVGSRLRPMRSVALAIGLAMTMLAVLGITRAPLAAVALGIAGVVTTTSNGLAFTAVAERAGSRWAGRALGVQNTFQNAIGALVPTPLALVIGAGGGHASGYGLAFGAVVVFPFIAALVIPTREEQPFDR